MIPPYRSSASRRGDARWWRSFTDIQVAVLVSHAVLGVWLQRAVPVVGLALCCAAVRRWRSVAFFGLIVGLAGAALSTSAWHEVRPDRLGPYVGPACLMTDPAPKGGATAAVFEIDGERFETWARGSPGRRLAEHLAGECTWISGERRHLNGPAIRRAAVRHVVGALQLDAVGDWTLGSPLNRASNRVRRLFGVGAAQLPAPDDSLYAGLVIGDDRNEPPEMVDQFRASGLAHLTAVSGSNVAFMLAAASPLLRRLRPMARWAATVLIIAWFVALTRFEPSILRAGVMAGIASTGFLLGREKPPARVLALAVGALVLVDPLLVWSVGFWLSVAATAGVAVLGPPLAKLLPGPSWLTIPASVTLGAQLAVAPITLVVFDSLPLVSVPANLVAVPVAGCVMLYGLPAGLVAGVVTDLRWLGALADPIAFAVQLPSAVGTRWIATVAALGARLEPPTPWPAIGWCVVIVWCVGRTAAAKIERRWNASGAACNG